MTNEAIKALMIFALYGMLEVILCVPSARKLKAALSTKAARTTKIEPNRVAAEQ